MRDYEKGLTLRVIPETVVQHSDTRLLLTVNPSAEGQKQFPAPREQLLPFLRCPQQGEWQGLAPPVCSVVATKDLVLHVISGIVV